MAAYIIIAIEQRPLGDRTNCISLGGVSEKSCECIHTENSRLGLLVAVAAAGLGVLDVPCGVVPSVRDGQEGYSQEAQVTEHCCWVAGGVWLLSV